MLPKKFRLPSFVSLNHSKTIQTPYLGVKYTSNNLLLNRYGCVISKKIDKKAVTRNRIRRLIHSCLEEKWLTHAGYDILFIVKKASVGVSRQTICLALDDIMRKI